MAAPAQFTTIVLDVGPSMHIDRGDGKPTHLEASVKAINLLVQHTVLTAKKDQMALVLFGTDDTKNDLNDDDDEQYMNITTQETMAMPDLDLLRFIENAIVPGNKPACFIDALVVAWDVLNKGLAGTKGAINKRILLFTNAGSGVKDADTGTIVGALKQLDVELVVIGIDDDDDDEDKKPEQVEGIKILKGLIDELEDSYMVSFQDGLSAASQFKRKQIKQTTTFRGSLEIADLKIPVYAYVRIKRETMPSFKKLSGLVDVVQNDPTSGVVDRETTYHLLDENETQVDKDDLIKGWKYGKEFITQAKTDEDSMKYKVPKRLALLCFVKADKIPRHYHMGASLYVFTPVPGDDAGATALSALTDVLYEDDTVGIVRYAARNNSAPKLCMIFPHIKPGYRCLMAVSIPFREDTRPYQFPSLVKNTKHNPTPEQMRAMDNFIGKMDLMEGWVDEDGDAMEALQPKLTYNPVIHHFHQCLHARALHPDEPLPALDPLIERYLKPAEKLVKDSVDERQKLSAVFPLVRKDTKQKTTAARLWQQVDSEDTGGDRKRVKGDGDGGDGDDVDDDGDFTMESILKKRVSHVGSTNPVADFVAIVGSNPDNLVVAARELMRRIDDIVDVYVGGPTTPFSECVKALRKELLANEPQVFNDYLFLLRDSIKAHIAQRQPFMDDLIKGKITPISADESPSSVVSAAEAAAFLDAPAAPAATAASATVDDEDDVDDLMDEL